MARKRSLEVVHGLVMKHFVMFLEGTNLNQTTEILILVSDV